MTDSRAFLRHTLATLAYRGAKAIRNAGQSFADYSCGETSRTPVRILAHIGDLMDWALSMSEGRREWKDSLPLPWEKECERFFAAVKKLDDYLASEKPLQVPTEKLFQGPIADALTHVGQIPMHPRIASFPLHRPNYSPSELPIA